MTRVLIVDDSAFMRNTIKGVLTNAGFEIAGEASDGYAAIAEYVTTRPDLVTLDLTMPDMNGVEALKAILEHDPSARVVIVSAVGHESLVIEAVSAGARDFVVKPFEADRVVDALHKALA